MDPRGEEGGRWDRVLAQAVDGGSGLAGGRVGAIMGVDGGVGANLVDVDGCIVGGEGDGRDVYDGCEEGMIAVKAKGGGGGAMETADEKEECGEGVGKYAGGDGGPGGGEATAMRRANISKGRMRGGD